MKLYYAMILCAASAACTAFLALHPLQAAAESRQANLLSQEHISELVTMAIPPYKW